MEVAVPVVSLAIDFVEQKCALRLTEPSLEFALALASAHAVRTARTSFADHVAKHQVRPGQRFHAVRVGPSAIQSPLADAALATWAGGATLSHPV